MYIVYNKTDGKIVQTVNTTNLDFLNQYKNSGTDFVEHANQSINGLKLNLTTLTLEDEVKALEPTITLQEVMIIQMKLLGKSVQETILGGFVSSALGASYTYPTKVLDQQNLIASITDSVLPHDGNWTTLFWCADVNGDWQMREHTDIQIQQVGREMKQFILTQQVKFDTLKTQVINASTMLEIKSVQW